MTNDEPHVRRPSTDWPAVLETLHESESRFEEAFEHAAIGMALVSPAGRWLRVNESLCAFLGYTGAELHDLTFQDLTYPPDLDADLGLAQQLLAGKLRSYQMEKRYIHRRGHLVWGLLSVSLVRATDGHPRYFISQIQDITTRKQIELKLRASEERFRILFEHSPDGVFLLDPHHPSGLWPIVDCNPAACAMNGYTRDALIGQSIDFVNAQADTPAGRAAFLDRLRRERSVRIDAVHRHADGTRFPITASTTLITLDGQEYLLGIDRDMTALRAAEQALQRANAELAARVTQLEQHAHAMQTLADMGGWLHACHEVREVIAVMEQTVTTICRDAEVLVALQAPPDAAQGGSDSTSVHQLAVPLEQCPSFCERQPYTDGGGCRACVSPGWRGSFMCLPLLTPGSALGVLHVQSAGGEPFADLEQQALLTVADQSALAITSIRLQQSLQEQAIRDPLTGLFNRRSMEAALAREIHRARRRALAIGVLLVDIDHFKQLNDTYGHPAGDTVLCAVAAYLQSHIRAEDIACRYGGEEFLLILPDVTEAALLQRASQLHAGIRELPVVHDQGMLGSVTVSIGVALFPSHGTTAEALVQAADAALYQAKKAGRNRVIVARAPLIAAPHLGDVTSPASGPGAAGSTRRSSRGQ